MLLRGRVLLLGFAIAPYLLIAASGDQKMPAYEIDVAPVLKAHCASCHAGPAASAGLDLTTVEGVRKVVKPAHSADSLLIQRLKGVGGTQMPMGFAALPKATIDRIAAWIDGGASFGAGGGKHWAYVMPVKLKPPAGSKNPIDAFVLQRLRQEGLQPSKEAGKETLLRRVYLDLIGMPPSPAEIDAFLADKRPDAYERVVDRLLKNPHYGERQAEPWLDLSRYADSDGYEKDSNRVAWTYRDWLIDAFNRNMPYDEFTVEQIAGDLLPDPTLDQLVATGFNRNTMFNREGGVDQEDAHFNVIVDRVGTTATVWMGSTLQCARCHDHKYDPFSQRDFYRMAAFYANSVILPVGPKSVGEEKWFESSIPVPSPAQDKDVRKLKTEIAEVNRRIQTWSPELQAAYEKWLDNAGRGISWTVLQPKTLKAAYGTILTGDDFGVVTASGPVPQIEDYRVGGVAGMKRISGIGIEAIASASLPAHGPGRAGNGNFLISHVSLVTPNGTYSFFRAAADFNQRDNDATKALGNDPNFGWAVDGAEGKSHEIVLELRDPIDVPPDAPIEVIIEQHWPGGQHSLGRFRVSLTSDDSPSLLLVPPDVRKLLAVREHGNAADQALKDYFRSITPLLATERARVVALSADLAKVRDSIPSALIMRDKPQAGPLTAYIHQRGEFLSPTELVTAGFPAVFGQVGPRVSGPPGGKAALECGPTDPAPVPHINDNAHAPAGEPKLTRLDLARWLVNKRNPLSARVEVNRLWEQFFGRGIVETSEDFGTQGARPSHPELLDWLACEFMDRGWDMKAMVRLIVTSATYKQSSNDYPALLAKDPQNILLARGPRFRLDAETIRDNMLAASGLLSMKMGGPSVYPPQPPGVWDTPYNGEQWMPSQGEDRYRRGLYTFVKRTSPYPSFLDFDATSRESCTVRRIRTNTPTQALALLNDESVMDAARGLGHRMEEFTSQDRRTLRDGLVYGFRLCTGRRPASAELTRLERLYGQLKARYQKDVTAAKHVAGTTDQAAWTMVANVLLNLDETVTKS